MGPGKSAVVSRRGVPSPPLPVSAAVPRLGGMSTEPTPSSATPETESAAAPSSSGLPQAAPQAAWPERVELSLIHI